MKCRAKTTCLVECRLVASLLAFWCLIAAPEFLRASGVVTNCTQAALDNALSGGGTVTFSCDGVIVLTNFKTISVSTVLDANGRDVTLNGQFGADPTNAVRLFYVNTN